MTLDDIRRDPYATFRRLRAEAPVARVGEVWVVACHADVRAVLDDTALFSSTDAGEAEPAEGPRFLLLTRSIIGLDPPRHTRLRRMIGKAFTPAVVRAMEPAIRSLCRRLLDEAGSRFDFIADFAMPLPVIVISELLGIDPARRADFKRWSDTLITWRNGRAAEAERQAKEMHAYFLAVIAERRRAPRADLISALVGEALTPAEVLGFVRLLLVAGNETTTNLLGNALLALLAHPAAWHADAVAIVEEALRFDSPAIALSRRATQDTELAGVRIAKGDRVLPLLASANHDERVFAEPERFDPARDTKAHLAFGTGAHFCLGAPLARLQARVAIEELRGRFATIARADAAPLAYLPSLFFRGVRSLPLTTVSTGGGSLRGQARP